MSSNWGTMLILIIFAWTSLIGHSLDSESLENHLTSLDTCQFPPKEVKLVSSIAPIQTLLLTYRKTDHLPHLPNQRLELYREVRNAFPELDIRMTSEIPEDALVSKAPELRLAVSAIAYIPESHNNIQDPFEFGWDYALDRPVVFRVSPGYHYYFDDFGASKKLFGTTPTYCLPVGKLPAHHGWKNGVRLAGGNIEVLPDGTPVVGMNMNGEAIGYLEKVSGKKAVLVDSSWLTSGDIDEVFLWTRDPLSKSKCILFQYDLSSGNRLALQNKAWNDVDKFRRPFLKLHPGLSKEFVTKPKGPFEEKLSEVVKREMEETRTELIKESKEASVIQTRIDGSSQAILSASGMKGCRSIRLPISQTSSANNINSLVIENHVFALDPEFTWQRREIERIFNENGFVIHWIPLIGFEAGAGGMHCNTNTIRRPELEPVSKSDGSKD